MLYEYNKIHTMVMGAYKKLKSHYYYDKTLMFIKHKIALFESDYEKFILEIDELTQNILNNNDKYFDDLIERIDFIVLPKKLVHETENTDIVKSNIDKSKNINKINFFIDAPVELLIIDLIWLLLIGKINIDNFGYSLHTYAGLFKQSVFLTSNLDLFSGIDFYSNRCFMPYFNLYSMWRDRAFDTVKEKQTETDIMMLSLDLKSFYYSVEFNFDSLQTILNNDKRLHEIEFITKIIEKMYIKYSNIVSKYKKGIRKQKKTSIFPIGLLSPVVLRELYLKNLDATVYSEIKPYYYGRYVDDILIVINANDMENISKKEVIEKVFVSKSIVSLCGNENYKFNGYPNIKIQSEKINCFFFKRNSDDIFINIYNDKIRVNASEANLMPDMDLLNESFINKAYEISSINGSNKIRDLGFMQCNNYNATLFVNGLKNILKNTIINNNDIDKYLDEVIDFYSESQSIEYANSWKSIFELFVLCKDKKRANQFYLNIKKYIEKLNFHLLSNDEVFKKSYNIILRRLKKNITQYLDIALSLAISLDYDIGKKKKHIDMAFIFRASNMLNHRMMSLPLINYSKEIISEFRSLIDFKIDKTESKDIFVLNDERLIWSPVFIHLDELYQFFFMHYFYDESFFYDKDFIFNRYININNLNRNLKNPLIYDNISINSHNNNVLRDLKIEGPSDKYARIGLVNTSINEQDALDCLRSPQKMLTTENKQRLFKILNIAKQEKSNFLIFPEFYMPYFWLHDITKFAKINGITIISGLHYFVFNKRAYNITCSINPTKSKKGYKNCLLFFREKNYYAPSERLLISKIGYTSYDNPKPLYHIISKSSVSYSTILCYEFTDISSRASMKSKIDILFVPQMNKDTNYFSSIVESSARDLHCFIVQANTSKYGDSRITAPFKTDYKNIVQIKGGINDIVIIGQLNIEQFRAFQNSYEKELSNAIKKCYNCRKLVKKDIKQIAEICNKCLYNLNSNFIKGLPPKFHREF